MNSIYFDPYVGTKDRYSAEEIIRAVALAGYDGLNLPDDAPFLDEDGKIKVRQIKSLVRRAGLEVYSILALGPSLTDTAVGFERIKQYYDYILDVCSELDVEHIGIYPGYEGVAQEEAFNKLTKNLGQLIPLVQKEGKNIIVEFEPKGAAVKNISEALELARRVPSGLKITCDTTHLSNTETDLYDAVLRLQACLGDVHISGRHRGEPEKDPCDFDVIFRALKDIDYQGPFLIQYRLEEDISTIKRSYLYTKRFIG